ncbi:MAG: NAD-dependent epimerase/dehydratase family protein [bacterium]|nr:NAD-dependent epimerase/dehydratase family protein [bacterium]
MSNILVTGGAGFIGSNLVHELIKQGEKVVVIDDLSQGKLENLHKKAKFYKLKVEDTGIFQIVKQEKIDYIFHLAAQIDVRKSFSNPILDAKSNIIGTINILQAAKEAGVRKFIFASSGGVIYGDTNKQATEEVETKPSSPYGISKLVGEKYLELYGKEYGIKYTIIRYANVYGQRQNPDGEAGVVAIFTKQMLNNKQCTIYGFGKMIRDYVYVKDAVDATILAMNKGENEIFNIGTGRPTSVNELFSIMKEITKYSITPLYKPKRRGELDRSILDCRKAEKLLKWKPRVTLEEGIRQTINWFKNYKNI